MKHLVLITGIYYPEPSPTGRCAHQYVSLLKDEYIVDVIYINSGLEKTYGSLVEGERLYGLRHWRLWLESWFGQKCQNSANLLLQRLFRLAVLGMKSIGRIQSMVFFPNNLRWFYKKAYRTLCRIHEEKSIDVVFTVNSPFVAHLAGAAFKKKYPEVRWVTYTVDPYYVGHSKKKNADRTKEKAFQLERGILSGADANLLSEEVYQNAPGLYDTMKERTYPLPYLLEDSSWHEPVEIFNKNCVNLVYAGRFYKDLRNPEYLLQTMLEIEDPKIVLHLYAASDCDSLIDAYVKKSEGRILRHEIVSSSEIKKVLAAADILVNVENTIPEFKPSKVFEYISMRKPIINFCPGQNPDATLTMYQKCITISQDEDVLMENALRIKNFCSGAKKEGVSWDDLERIYSKHLPKGVRCIIQQAIAGNLEKLLQDRGQYEELV